MQSFSACDSGLLILRARPSVTVGLDVTQRGVPGLQISTVSLFLECSKVAVYHILMSE